ncbi:hypothetical protein [Streptococcus sp. zg-JUN1979]|uniref:hypothetical protein n=1 Tax=Streptococcus sp. zg-JUN1979 TaxID=3391450 RepID=UPI0039B0F0A7
MAFEPKKAKLNQALQKNDTEVELVKSKVLSEKPRRRKVGRPKGKQRFNYTFTLEPESRDKLDLIAEQEGYNGVSTFLNDWIKHYKLK